MKTTSKFLPFALTIFMFAASCSGSKPKEEASNEEPAQEALIELSGEMMTIVETKCIGCHSADSKNEKAKEDLIWAELPTMKKLYLSKKLYDIQEVLEDGEMPPEKFVAKKPEMKLTEEETTVLMKWTEESLAALGY